jgi:hypothetical protein
MFGKLVAWLNGGESAQQESMIEKIVESNRDVVDGYELCVTMNEATPLTYLNRHQEFKAVLSAADKGIDPRFGIWIPKVNSSFSLLSEGSTMASNIGPIPADGGAYLPKLKRVRSIIEQPVEGDDVTEAIKRSVAIDKLDGVKKYMGSSEPSILSKGALNELLPNIDDYLIRFVLDELNLSSRSGLQIKHVKQLYLRGYTTIQSMKDAPDEVLLALPGVGAKTIVKIRSR